MHFYKMKQKWEIYSDIFTVIFPTLSKTSICLPFIPWTFPVYTSGLLFINYNNATNEGK